MVRFIHDRIRDMNDFKPVITDERLDEILRLAHDNNKMLRAIRRDAWLHLAYKTVTWLVVLGVVYFLVIQHLLPLFTSLQGLQQSMQGVEKTQSDIGSVIDQYKNLLPL